ncbi:MAG TPA: hypothetical protein VFG83_12395, partial [Kofleriaceae bacterium]|nr:hypothetical protein [Kofleriaceae bacterium]
AARLQAAQVVVFRCSLTGEPAAATVAAADARARARAHAARTLTGHIPIPAKIAYAIARDLAAAGEGRAALPYYWRASALSQLAIDLALSTPRGGAVANDNRRH